MVERTTDMVKLSTVRRNKVMGHLAEAQVKMTWNQRGTYQEAIKHLADAIAILVAACATTKDDREDITGISTRGTNKNFGNSGFSGGCTLLAGYAGG